MKKYFRSNFLFKSIFNIYRIKVVHTLTFILPSQSLISDPNLTQILGQYGLLSSEFCKNFNECSNFFKSGTLVPTHVYIYENKKYELFFTLPHISFFIKSISNILIGNLGGLKNRFKTFFFLKNPRFFRKKIKRFSRKKGFIFLKQLYTLVIYYFNHSFNFHLTILSFLKSILGTIKSMGLKICYSLN